MPSQVHTVENVPGASPYSAGDRLRAGLVLALANAAGGSAGAAVTVAVTGLSLPAKYFVSVSPNQDARWYISAKTQSGFTVNLLPGLASETIAAGTIDLAIFA